MSDDKDGPRDELACLEVELKRLFEGNPRRDEWLAALQAFTQGFRRIERARTAWTEAFDAIRDPVFLHDKDFRVVRVNRAYATRAGMPIGEILGKPYWQVFPKGTGPLPCCLRALEKAEEEEVNLASGEVLRSRTFSVRDERGKHRYSVHILEDVTERRRAEEALQESEERLRAMAAGAQDAILMIDGDGLVTFWNPAAERLFGHGRAEALGQPIHALIVPPPYRDKHIEGLARFKASGEGPVLGQVLELPALRKDGAEFPVELSLSALQLKGRWHAVGILRDITERKKMETELRETRDYLGNLFDYANAPIIVWDPSFRITMFNHAFERLTGRDADEVIGKEITILFPPDHREEALAHIHRTTGGERWETVEIPILHSGGEVRTALWNSATLYAADGKIVLATIAQGQDITERKKAEATLRKTAAELKEAQHVAHLGSWSLDTETGNILWSEELHRIFGRDPAQPAPAYEELLRILTPESYARMNAAIEKTRQTGEPYELDLELIRPDGTRKWITARGEARRDLNGKIVGLRGTAIDITGRKKAEQSLRRANRALQTLSGVNQVLIKVLDEQLLLGETCRVIVETGGYRMAKVSYADDNPEKSLRRVASAGAGEDFFPGERLTWADTEKGQVPITRAIRSGMPVICHDIADDPGFALWKNAALAQGYASNIGLPLSDGRRTFGGLSIYSAEKDVFDDEEARLLTELANDLAYGIVTLRTRIERDHFQEQHLRGAERLKQALVGTIQAVATTVEKRDPYTAGHQQRAAQLCAAIASELGLGPERIEGVRLGALIHDIGKIYVPAEILNRPGKLTTAEFEIIKSHSQVGYDIIKDVKFPWPVGEMILQHHERLDGSGYPQGLKGEAIIYEARILAVADVIEAMSAHRPYRPARGVEPALEELRRNRGRYYDPEVVDACLRLFEQGKFQFDAAAFAQ